MKHALFYICAFLLIFPIQSMSYVQTLAHLANYIDEQSAGHDESNHHEGEEESMGPSLPHLMSDHEESHRHAPDQSPHSHDKDMWGLFSIFGLSQNSFSTKSPDFTHPELPLYKVQMLACNFLCRSLLRPPIG